MPADFDTHLLLVIAVVALVAWRVQARIRRVIGRQRPSSVRPWITVVVLALLLVLVLAGSPQHPPTALAAAAGVAVGIGLGVLGLRPTTFEATPAGLFYTPDAHLGIALSLPMVLCLGWRVASLATLGRQLDPQSLQPGASPLTMAIFGTLAGYYVTWAIGLLRWRSRVGAPPPVQH